MKKISFLLLLVFSCPNFLYSEGVLPLSVGLDRALAFKEAGLITMAREEYRYLLTLYPKEVTIQNSLKNLGAEETKLHLANALHNKDLGALPLALRETNLALASTPDYQPAKDLRNELTNEINLRKGLQGKTSEDYLKGIQFYDAGKWDRSLESFVKVLNMDPHHKGALSYIEKLGQKMSVGVPQ